MGEYNGYDWRDTDAEVEREIAEERREKRDEQNFGSQEKWGCIACDADHPDPNCKACGGTGVCHVG